MPWNPEQYHQFQAARSAPFEDIVALIAVRDGLRAVDLGCGTGELTRRLADRLPGCDMLGLDNSPEMLERAGARVTRNWQAAGHNLERGELDAAAAWWEEHVRG